MPKLDSKIRLQFRDHAVITVEPDQENSVSITPVSPFCGSGCGCVGMVGEFSLCCTGLSQRVVQVWLGWVLRPVGIWEEIMRLLSSSTMAPSCLLRETTELNVVHVLHSRCMVFI